MNLDILQHYKTNIYIIDTEHVDLFVRINIITENLHNKTKCSELLVEFMAALKLHDVNEETYMSKIDYPYLRPHLEDHRRIAVSLKRKVQYMTESLSANTNRYHLHQVTRELLDHIDHHDIQIGEFVRKKTQEVGKENKTD